MKNLKLSVSPDGQSLLVQIPLSYVAAEFPANAAPTITVADVLTPHELEVFRLIQDGALTAKDLARALNLSLRTVKYHLSNIYRRLYVRGMADLLRRYPSTCIARPLVPPRKRKPIAAVAAD